MTQPSSQPTVASKVAPVAHLVSHTVSVAFILVGIPGTLALLAGQVTWAVVLQHRQNRGRPRMVKLSDYPQAPQAARAPGPDDELLRQIFGNRSRV